MQIARCVLALNIFTGRTKEWRSSEYFSSKYSCEKACKFPTVAKRLPNVKINFPLRSTVGKSQIESCLANYCFIFLLIS